MKRPEQTVWLGPRRPSPDLDAGASAGDVLPDPRAESVAGTPIGRACDDFIDRWRRGDRRTVESYCDDWTGGPPGHDDLFELIYIEYLLREELGEAAADLLAARFPAHADRLRRQVAMHEVLLDSSDFGGDIPVLAATLPEAEADGRGGPMASLAGYEILRVLGRGGMGVVYEARQIRLNRPVALKMIRAGIHASPEDRSRFLAEAEAIARLRHPNIVQVHSFGDSDGQPYFEMEYVDGGSLADRCDGIPRPPREASALLETVARAIHEAHRRGVVHRDLKPSNILLMADGSPKIADFGLAKLIGSDSGLTRTDSVLGSPAYMSPEQAAGQAGAVGPAADVYALGAIYYEMLTGRQAFVAESALETLDLVRNTEPVPPSRLRPGLARDVETICLRCLAKDPGRRYPTAEALADDLGSWLRGESIRARPTGLLERGYRWSLRNRAVATLIASIVLLLIGGTTGMAVLWARARAEASNARSLAGKEARANVELARVSADLMLDRGLALAEAGDAARGLPFMARAAQLAPDVRGGVASAARANLSAWSPLVPPLIGSARLGTTPTALIRSPDRRFAAIGGADGSLSFWDLDRLASLHATGPRPGGEITRVAFRDDGRVAASYVMETGLVQLWDVATGLPTGTRLQTKPGWGRLAFRPDGLALAVSSDSNLWLWDLESGQPICAPIAQAGVIRDLAFSHVGPTLITANEDGLVERRDGRTGMLLGRGSNRLDDGAWSIAVHPDGTRYAIGYGPYSLAKQLRGDRSGVQCYRTETGEAEGPRLPHAIGVSRLAYRFDGQVLLSGDYEGQAKLWDARGRPIGEPLRNDGAIEHLDFSPDGSIALTHSKLGPARLWDTATGDRVVASLNRPGLSPIGFDAEAGRVIVTGEDRLMAYDVSSIVTPAGLSLTGMRHIHFSPDNRTFLGALGNVARIVSIADGRPIGWPMSHLGQIQTLAISRDGRLVATGGCDATVRIWDAEGRPVIPPIPIRHWSSALRFSPDGSRLLSADETGDVRLIDVATGKTLHPPRRHPSGYVGSHVMDVFFSEGGEVGYSVSNSGTIGRLDGVTGEPISEFWDYGPKIMGDQISPDSRSLLLVDDSTIRVIDLKTGQPRFPALGRSVRSACYTPDGRMIVGGCGEKAVRFWDAETGEPVGLPIAHPQPVYVVKINGDGRTLLTMADDGMSRTWDLASRKQVGPARPRDNALAGSDFSRDGRFLAVTGQATRLYPITTPETGPTEALPGRVAALTGVELDAQGGLNFADESVLHAPPASRSIDPEADDWHARVGVELGLRGQHAAAEWHLARSVAARPGNWRSHAALSDSLARLGRSAESQAEADRARSLAGPLQAARWDAGRGLEALRDHRWADAVAAFDRVLAFDPPGPEAFHDARGLARVELKDWAGASADFAAGTWRTYSMMHDIQRAIVVAVAADDERAYRDLVARLTQPRGEQQLSIKPLANLKALLGSLRPGPPEDSGWLVQLAEPASRIVESPGDLDFIIFYGWALYRDGQYEAAIDQLTKVIQEHRLDTRPIPQALLAMAHRKLGRKKDARDWLDRAEHQVVGGGDYQDEIIWAALLREAQATVRDADFPSDPFGP